MSVTLKPSDSIRPTPSVDLVEVAPAGETRNSRRQGIKLAALVGVLALATGACALVWLSSSAPSSTPTPGSADPFEVDQPGGSAYLLQVPSAASRPSSAESLQEGFGPGSATYSEQVPSAAH